MASKPNDAGLAPGASEHHSKHHHSANSTDLRESTAEVRHG